ncbi:neutral/alkaline non-lysosomal ceramidase N-terminal domain-containing protein [Sphingomonas sp.]|uniref:neutral/alkaline non-lysosomal ceramidase N-terminal domain-containing protein n=1 Tax=Sphingomonas sp. TaxID=28214 RepID=UPI001B2C7819|nr:neutral/alkaline non-lysosomal ceramidase N-terminal domain-containing protein [Sphingomonas sp.]MBO9711724.1 neutral/alkaline non-lysosomal ceramidase N-terminal domain-containing protein [Sphingomonas sp.]
MARSIALLAALIVPALSPATAQGQLRVGAAKVDVTPSADKMPKTMHGVLDPLHARAIVVESGGSRAAMVTVDAGAIPTPIWQRVSARAARELKIPVDQFLLTATHTHSAPFVRDQAYEDQIFDAVRKAAAALQPARMAYGTGVSYINVNRNIIDPETHRWWEGPNYDGPSDKTVAVVEFETLAGAPIAVYYNYGVHGVLTGTLDMISADIPGAASNYIEDSLGGNAVAVYSNGAAGDQNPIFFQQTYDLRAIRIKDYAARGEDISNAMPPGGQGLDRNNPQVVKLLNQQKQMTLTMGQMLGEEVLHVTRSGLERPVSSADIRGVQETVMCPGRKRLDQGRAGYPGTYEDADPIGLKLSLLRIGDTVIGGVDAEIFTMIAQRFKRESPLKHTMMVTLTNGVAGSGYIPNDAAYGFNTFEVVSSRLKPGCAETAIVNGFLDLITKTEVPASAN